MAKPLVETKARVGVFSIALGAYLPQFPSLVPEFEAQYEAFKKTLPDTVEIIDGGMVTTKEQSMEAGDKFRAADVDLVILQMLTYCTSYNMLPAVRDLDVPVVIVNLQKKLAPDYEKTDIPTWLGELYACGAIGEMVADLNRAGKRSAVIAEWWKVATRDARPKSRTGAVQHRCADDSATPTSHRSEDLIRE